MEWLLGVVNHLPSEDQCQKCLVAPVDDKEKHDDMMLGRTKCYDLVTKVGLNLVIISSTPPHPSGVGIFKSLFFLCGFNLGKESKRTESPTEHGNLSQG